ncbi:MAG: discoidin domain-containing protein [Clostridiaceae bacterium]|nr:discoidin domain-containing protein [Clostridiaceae bacterium]
MKKGKRVLSVILTLAMVFSLLVGMPNSANAATDTSKPTESYSYLVASANSKIIHADSKKTNVLKASSTAHSDGESFKVISNNDGTISLFSKATNCYVTVDKTKNYNLFPKSSCADSSGKFTIEIQPDGKTALKAIENEKYVTVDLAHDDVLLASSTTVGINEKFTIVSSNIPEAPTGLTVSSKTANSVSLKWTSVKGATGYNVYRSTSPEGVYTRIQTCPGNSNNYKDTRLNLLSTYYYKVSSVSSGAESALSAEVSVTTAAYSYIVALANSLIVQANSKSIFPLTANSTAVTAVNALEVIKNSDGTVSFFCIKTNSYVCCDALSGYMLVPRTTMSIGSWEKFNLETQTDGTVAIKAVNNKKYVTVDLKHGNVLVASSTSLTIKEKFAILSSDSQAAPTGLAVSDTSTSSVGLSWNTVAYAKGYNLYRSNTSEGSYTKINATLLTQNKYSDTGLIKDTTYYYKVSVVTLIGESVQSSYILGNTAKEIAPETPTGLKMSSNGVNSIALNWNNTPGATSYNVFSSTSIDGTYTQLNTSAVTSTSYTAIGLTGGTAYYYKVSAENALGKSEQSTALFATTFGYSTHSYLVALANSKIVQASENPMAPLKASASEATSDPQFFDVVYGADGYIGFASVSLKTLVCTDSWNVPDFELLPRSGMSTNPGGWEAFTTEPQGDGTIAIKANNGGNYVTVDAATGILKATSSTVGINEKFCIVMPTAPKQPTGLTVTETYYNSVSLSWTAPVSSITTGYNVYRSTTSGGPYTKINTSGISITSYTDTTVVKGTNYYYVVSSVNSSGDTKSTEVNVKTQTGDIPSVPAGLDISSSKTDSIGLSWNAAFNATSYNVYRSESKLGVYTKINTNSVVSTSYTDKALATTSYYYKISALNVNGESALSVPMSKETKLFGPNVYIFAPTDSAAEIQATTSALFKQQEAAQFENGRYSVLFKPGTYTTDVKVGFYTQVAGLGLNPDDTSIKSLNVDAKWLPDNSSNPNNATCNFWRSVENLAVNSNSMWAVSQAAPLRRVHIKGDLSLHAGGWASGGFLSDSKIDGTVEAGGQQQWFTRNTDFNVFNGGVWNMVYVGNTKLPNPTATGAMEKNTVVDKTPVVEEKPFLYADASNNYKVFVPGLQNNSKGTTWDGKEAVGKSLSIDEFYVTHPETDTAATINAALSKGKNLLLTPGIYHMKDTIKVTKANTVVLGLGFASIVPDNGVIGMTISDVDGVRVAGIIMDAGSGNSPVLMKVGEKTSSVDHSANPTVISDLVCRIGGDLLGRVVTALEINSNNVIGDDLWVWRADHGKEVAWNKNTAINGMIVNGKNVTMFGLMVEHFQQYQTVWNGNGGKTYFYQSEIPYDVPDQASWMSHNGTVNGYSSYKVADGVTSHEAWALGIYSFFNQKVDIDLHSAMEVPAAPGVKVHNVCDVMLAGNPGITHVINNTGDIANTGGARQLVTEYCNNADQPVIEPKNAMFKEAHDVTITCIDPTASIMYTIDGTMPTSTKGIKYTGPFSVAATATVNAIAYKVGLYDSVVATSKITIDTSLASDLAFKMPALASTGKPELAFDGNLTTTRWESASTDPQWISVDLGKTFSVTGAKLDWEWASAQDYKIQVSEDNITWTDAYVKVDAAAAIQHRIDEITFEVPVSGRYVRMYGTTRTSPYGYSLWEFMVYGK